jgi:DNA polymerase
MRLQEFLQDHAMSKTERRDFLLTERVNDTGLPVDVALAKTAMAYGILEAEELSGEIVMYSSHEVMSAGSHGQVKKFLKARLDPGVFEKFFTHHVNGEKKETSSATAREAFLASTEAMGAESDVVDLLRSLDDANKSSVAKFGRIVARANDAGRVQGAYLYAGAAQTKRFSSTGVQMHNLPRTTPKDLEKVVRQVMTHTLPAGERVMHVLSACLRPTIAAPKGRVLIWGDWSAVEARAMPWLAGCKWKLDLYRDDIDVYCANAHDIFGTPYDKVTDDQRQVGKVAELSLQFGGWANALRSMARGYRIKLDEGEAKDIASAWRNANPWAADYQWALFFAFLNAAATGEPSGVGGVVYRRLEKGFQFEERDTIECTLPDKTVLLYPGAAKGTMQKRPHTWGENWKDEVFDTSTIAAYHTDRKRYKATVQYFKAAFNKMGMEEDIWHGLLAENVTQGICASLLRDCLARVEARLDPKRAVIIGHTHDEILLEADERWEKIASGILQEEMVRVPKWMLGMPLGATIKSGVRYTK